LDRFRRTCTQQLIRQLALVAHQVIVLSHDPLFLKLIWDSYPPAEIKVLQLSQSGNTTLIGEFDIEAETQSVYLKNYSTLLNFYRDRTGTPLDVARAIRPFLEGLLRSRFPGHFQPAEWLGDFIGKIRAAGPNDGLHDAQTDLQELKNINDYSKKYHHDQNARADSEAISTDELHGFVKRTLRLVGGS
jgi:wobble nucleotide-excising tRNase